MIKVNKTQYAILGMLSIEPRSGYAIRQFMQTSTANFWSESDGQLYPALANLVKQDMITSKTVEKNNPRAKKIYRITSKGLNELKQWLSQEPETHTVRNELMLKLFFSANTEPKIILEHIHAHRYKMKAKLTQLLATKKTIEPENKNSPHLLYWLMSLDFGIKMVTANIAWCDDVIYTLEKRK